MQRAILSALCSLIPALVLLALPLPARAGAPETVPDAPPVAVFQYSAPVETERGERAAFLWVPPEAPRIRGIVAGGMTLMERECVKDARIREACASESLAILFLACGLGQVDFQKALDDLADASGYDEIRTAPVLFIGHSAGGPQAKMLATRLAARCFGLVQYRGGLPGGAEPLPPGIPALAMVGQFDEFAGTMRSETGREAWEGPRDQIASFRAQSDHHLVSIVVEPGAGHFAWSERNARYLALFIRKAARARIPPGDPAREAPAGSDTSDEPRLREIDPRAGWLTDLDIAAETPSAPTAASAYRGERERTSWHLDRELAEATIRYHRGGFGKTDQFIRWRDPHWVDAGTRFFFTRLEWVGDGQTIEVHPEYADVVPSVQRDGRGPRWPGAGEPVGHSATPIRVRPVSGPVVAAGPHRLRIRYDALAPAGARTRVTFLAWSDGDDEHRYTEQVGMMPRGFSGLKRGKAQTITFPPPGNVPVGGDPVELGATSDAGLDVEYYVAFGPLAIEDGRLLVRDLPARARFPVKARVVAYQFGRGLEPLVKTAEPVARDVLLVRP